MGIFIGNYVIVKNEIDKVAFNIFLIIYYGSP